MGFENVAADTVEANRPLHERYRDEFPVTRNLIYLNHAAVSPLCRRAAEAMRSLSDDACFYGSLHYDRWMEGYAGLRRTAAHLINCSPAEIAIVKNTSEGVAIIAGGFGWNRGDRIIAFKEEFPSNYYPWLRLERVGVEVTWLSIYDSLDRIAEAAKGAKLLAISFVNYLSGFRVDLEALGQICHQTGCFFFVDAIQGLGAFPLDVQGCRIDALAADGHKWMLGPEGNGILYVRREWLDRIEPVEFGWSTPAKYTDYSSRDMTLREDAGRYECGTLNTVGCFGLRAALELLLEVGVEHVSRSILSLVHQLETGLRDRGCELMLEGRPENRSGIVSFRHPEKHCLALLADLKRAHVLGASRQGWIRFSPHFYLNPDEINYVLEQLPAA